MNGESGQRVGKRFDLAAFETQVAKRLETHPRLRAVHTGASALALCLIVAGLALGWRRFRRRRAGAAPPPPGAAESAHDAGGGNR